ncbi:cation transporter [Fodinicurvata fenggangensis]|uniref:cation transporter n=1 Tax=Fodinicurvata fenggangensis TaxID=1121830 RepID=UPI00068FCDFF|nr:cation diffusion facilitator family transporter [Fodinicurvata fenggangensis]
MAGCHHCATEFDGNSKAFRRVLWTVMGLNGLMFAVEIVAGVAAGSLALLADAGDFLGDTLTYGISLAVIGSALRVRAGAALFKAFTLAALGLFILAGALYRVFVLGTPDAMTMGTVGLVALAVNAFCALLLFRFREGDANVRSVWLCSRNDAIGNLAVLLAASGVWASGTAWPDLVVGGLMGAIFLSSAWSILRQALGEWRHAGQEAGAAQAETVSGSSISEEKP